MPLPTLSELGVPVLDPLTAPLPTLSTSAPLSAMPAAPIPPNAAPLVAQQLATALNDPTRDPGAAVELALDPPELGRVRMTLTEVAGTLTLVIHADRPETADLMRRHMDLLNQEFARSGLEGPSVQIGDGDGDARSGQGRPDPSAPTDGDGNITAPIPGTDIPNLRAAQGGLDLRL